MTYDVRDGVKTLESGRQGSKRRVCQHTKTDLQQIPEQLFWGYFSCSWLLSCPPNFKRKKFSSFFSQLLIELLVSRENLELSLYIKRKLHDLHRNMLNIQKGLEKLSNYAMNKNATLC